MTAQPQLLCGPEIAPVIEALGQFRIDVFRDFPYLYEGDIQHERSYLARYSQCPQARLLLITDEDGIKAACTAIPLFAETEEFRAPFSETEQQQYFYIGEVMVRADARGQKLGTHMLQQMLSLIEAMGYHQQCLYTVDRGQNHPAQPKNYRAPDSLWQNHGFQKTGAQLYFSWKDVGDSTSSRKPMNVWARRR